MHSLKILRGWFDDDDDEFVASGLFRGVFLASARVIVFLFFIINLDMFYVIVLSYKQIDVCFVFCNS